MTPLSHYPLYGMRLFPTLGPGCNGTKTAARILIRTFTLRN